MDSLADSCFVTRAYESSIQQNRRKWGQVQYALHQKSHGLSVKSSSVGGRLPMGGLFQLIGGRTNEQSWTQALFVRLCQLCHPQLLQDEREAHQLVKAVLERLESAQMEGKTPSNDPYQSFTGNLSTNEDLLAIPLDPSQRKLWVELLVGRAPASRALLDWIDLASHEPVPLEQLPYPVVSAIFGRRGAEELLSCRPDLRESLLPTWLNPEACQEVQELILLHDEP
jgi:hypothetical protein